jgi:PAS domain S-box-containing protein
MSIAVIQVPSEIVQKWQEIVNIIAEIIHVPSALIMKVEPPNIKVFVSSESNGNPYERDELAPLNTGLYCETVMKTRQSLLVADALREEEWKSNPDIKLGMISYLGFPVTWPDGRLFGTICVLDKKENSYSELYRKFVVQCRDVLEADLRALARSEAYLEEAQRLSHTGSFGWRVSTGEIVLSKESFRIFGYDQSLAVTLDRVIQRVHPEDRALVQRTLDRASRDGKDLDHEYRLLTPDDSIKHVHVVAHAVRDHANELEFIGAVMDVTEPRRVEQQMHQARTEHAHVARVATAGELAAAIAHEIRQPITGMVTMANAALRWLSRENPDIGRARDAMNKVVVAGHQASDVITNVRGLFGKDTQEKTATDLNTLIQSVLAMVSIDLHKQSIESQLTLSEQLPPVVGNEVQLQQVILNLVMNAIESMDSAETRVLSIKSGIAGRNGVRVSIADTGSGIDQANLNRIFEPMFTTKARGMGMGLSICKSIIESHNGRIWLMAGSSRGSVFQFELPTGGAKH